MRQFPQTLVLAFSLLFSFLQSVHAQDRSYPIRSVTIVHPFAAGGIGYQLALVIGEHLKKQHNIDIVVEAKPGAGSVIGALSVARAEPDGHSLLINATSIFSLSGMIYKKPPYDPAHDFAPVALVARTPLVLVVNSELPIHSLEELSKLARSTPGGLSFSTVGTGGAQHLSGELLKSSLKTNLVHVPYRGPVQAVAAVAGGHVAMIFADLINALPMIKAGKIRPIAVTSSDRAEVLPGVPTFAELGLGGFDYDLQFGIFAPAKTSPEIIAKLNTKVRGVVSDGNARAKFAQQGVQLIETPPPNQLRVIIHQEIERWKKLLQGAGLAGSQ